MFIDPTTGKSVQRAPSDEEQQRYPLSSTSKDKLAVSQQEDSQTEKIESHSPALPKPSTLLQYLDAIPTAISKLMREVIEGDIALYENSKQFSLNNVKLYHTSFDLLVNFRMKLLTDSVRYKQIVDLIKLLEGDEKAWKEIANVLNNTMSEFMGPPPIWEKYNDAVKDFNEKFANGVPYEEAIKDVHLLAIQMNTLIDVFNVAATKYNEAIDKYNEDLVKYIREVQLANSEIDKMNEQRKKEGLGPIPHKDLPQSLQPIPQSAKISSLPKIKGGMPSAIAPFPISPINYSPAVPPMPIIDPITYILTSWLPLAFRMSIFTQAFLKLIDSMNEHLIPGLVLFKQTGKDLVDENIKRNLSGFVNSFAASSAMTSLSPDVKISMETFIKEILKAENVKENSSPSVNAEKISERIMQAIGFLLDSTSILGVKNVLGNFGSALPFLPEGSFSLTFAYSFGFMSQVQELLNNDSLTVIVQETLESLPEFSSLTPQAKDDLSKSLLNFAILSLTDEILALQGMLISPALPLISSAVLLEKSPSHSNILKEKLTESQGNLAVLDGSIKQFYQDKTSSVIFETGFKEIVTAAHFPEKERVSLAANISGRVSELFAKDLPLEKKLTLLRSEIVDIFKDKIGEALANTVATQLILYTLNAPFIEQIIKKIQEEAGDKIEVESLKKTLTTSFIGAQTLFTDTVLQMTETQSEKLASAARSQFRHFIEEIINPKVVVERIIAGIKEPTGIMTEGMKSGFQRGDVDIPV